MPRSTHVRVTYANVTASLALFVALGGTGYAAVRLAAGSVGSREIRNSSIKGIDVKNRSLHAIDLARGQLPAGAPGPRGQAGPTGPKGDAGGPKGDTGATGASGGSAIWAIINGPNPAKTLYGSPSGTSSADATDTNVALPFPSQTLVARDFHVTIGATGPTNPGSTWKLSLEVKAPGSSAKTTMICVIAAAPGTECSPTSTVSIPADSAVSVEIEPSAPPTAPGPASKVTVAYRVALP